MNGVTYAIIIAVENYNESKDFPKVDYASDDFYGFKSALLGIGVHEDNILPLDNQKATKSAILSKVKKFVSRATEYDRIIFYFAGHGFYEDKKNLIAPVDAIMTDKSSTCIPIIDLINICRDSRCNKTILFLDSCHSGFLSNDKVRSGISSFQSEELIHEYRDEEFCIGFASCKSGEESISHVKLKNGVWTHFLIKALSGDGGNIYEEGLLFSDKLQKYLKRETVEFVKQNTKTKRDQTPIKFGSESDRFIVADLTYIFEERKRERLEKEMEEESESISFEDISMLEEEEGYVKSLPGFVKGRHSIPVSVNSSANRFIKDIGQKIIDDEITEISKEITKHLKYGLRGLKASKDSGVGSIETPDFDYSIEIFQSDEDPGEYIIRRKIDYIKNPKIIENEIFNRTFTGAFNTLKVDFPTDIDLEELITKIEDMRNEDINIDYDPSTLEYLSIEIKGNPYEIIFTNDSFSVITSSKKNPKELTEAFKETQKSLSNNNLQMLNE